MTKKNTVHFILTGGTIDSFYDGTKDTAVPNESSVIPQYIKGLKLYNDTEFTEICMKDSRELSKEDIKNVYEAVEQSKHSKIIIIHGTYTMPDTAKYLSDHLKRDDQTIVITGSMIPLLGFSPSDASFNLGFALAKVNELDRGIYVVMNGGVFSPEEVRKDLKEGRFVSIFSK